MAYTLKHSMLINKNQTIPVYSRYSKIGLTRNAKVSILQLKYLSKTTSSRKYNHRNTNVRIPENTPINFDVVGKYIHTILT